MHFRLIQRSYHYSGLTIRGIILPIRKHMLHSKLLNRRILNASLRYAATDRSKVEYTLKMLKEDLQKQQDEEAKKLKLVHITNNDITKPTLMQKVVHEMKHYYHGFRLLALETKLSTKYMWRVLRGDTLSRRERQQLVRTVSDLFRLVPFSIFIIVPFMELALPIFIKLFPNMLPSTFQESSKEEEKLRRQVKVKVEMAKFLQDTIEEIALEKRTKAIEPKDSKALEFAKFIKKVRSEGGYVSNEELFKFSKLFEDELTLDNLSMSQLRSLCRLMVIQPLGSPEILRFQLNMKLRELKADDKQIVAEGGVDALTILDLQQACRARGMRAIGLSEGRLRDQLKQWLELSLSDKVPPSLLLLSRALYLPEDISFTDRLKALVQNLPDGIAEQTRQKLTEMEGGQVDHKARIELIKQIEDAIAKEKTLAIEKRKEEEKQRELQKKVVEEKHKEGTEEDKLAETIRLKTKDLAQTTALENINSIKGEVYNPVHVIDVVKEPKVKTDDSKVDPMDLSSIEQILVGGPLHEAKHDIIGLKEKVIEHTEDLIEINALDGAFSETKVAKRLRSKLNSMIENVDSLVTRLEEEKRNISETIVDPSMPETTAVKMEKQVRVQDLIESITKLQKLSLEENGKKERIEQLLKSIDEDSDGIIDADIVLEVIALLEKHGDVSVSPSQLGSVICMLKKEDHVEAMEKTMDSVHLEGPILPQGSSMADTSIKQNVENDSDDLSIPDVDQKVTAQLRKENRNSGRHSEQSSL